jgi:hypothetical protein
MKVPAFLELQLTHRCHLDCAYCFLKRGKPDMSEALLLQGIDFLFTSSKRDVWIQWFGGEPLLRFDLIQKGIPYALNKNKNGDKALKFFIATNGMSLSRGRAEFLVEHGASFIFSLDGMAPTQQSNRPFFDPEGRNPAYPFDKLVERLRMLQQLRANHFVNMVVGPDNVDALYDNVAWLVQEMNVKDILMSYRLGVFWTPAAQTAYLTEAARVLADFGHLTRLMNQGTEEEPVLASTSINLDTDGQLYMGCTLTMFDSFPDFEVINDLGHIDQLGGFDDILVDRVAQEKNLRDGPYIKPKTQELVVNNLDFGQRAGVVYNR